MQRLSKESETVIRFAFRCFPARTAHCVHASCTFGLSLGDSRPVDPVSPRDFPIIAAFRFISRYALPTSWRPAAQNHTVLLC